MEGADSTGNNFTFIPPARQGVVGEARAGECVLLGRVTNFHYDPETLKIQVLKIQGDQSESSPDAGAHIQVVEPPVLGEPPEMEGPWLVPVIPEEGEFADLTYSTYVDCNSNYRVLPTYYETEDSCEWHGTWSPRTRTVNMEGEDVGGIDFTFSYDQDRQRPDISITINPPEPRFNVGTTIIKVAVTDDNPIDEIDITEHYQVLEGTSIVQQTSQSTHDTVRDYDGNYYVNIYVFAGDNVRQATIDAEVCDYGGNRDSESFSISFGTCRDGIMNQGEGGVDCGGPCAPCNRCDDDTPLPQRFNWNDYDTATPLKNQAACGSCWAFAANAAAEHNYKWATGKAINLSEQRLISCEEQGSGCWGGFPYEALPFLQYDGTVTETCFDYQSGDCCPSGSASCGDCFCSGTDYYKPCTCDHSCYDDAGWVWGRNATWTIADWGGGPTYGKLDDVKRLLLCKGPLVSYSPMMEHTMLLVGWDSDNQTCRDRYDRGSCWILKSSWGDNADGWFESVMSIGTDDIYLVNGYVLLPTFDHYWGGTRIDDGIYSDVQKWLYWVSGTARGLETGFEEGDSIAVGHFQSGDVPDQILIKRHDSNRLKILKYDDTREVRNLLTDMDIKRGDRIAVGDLDHDGIDEVIFGDTDDNIQIYSSRLDLIREFDRTFSDYDGLAVGNLSNTGGPGIIRTNQRTEEVTIMDAYGSTISNFHSPDNIQEGDAVAAGNLDGRGRDEIVLASRNDHVYLLNWDGTEYGDPIDVRFDYRDGLGVGDFNGDGRAEIVIVNDYKNRLRVFNGEGTLIKEFYHEYGHGGSTSAGDVNGDGRDELVIAQGDIIRFNEMFG
ncbi:MAG: FG-GAP-like repeat-containing protein [Methanomicrobiales archaeon]|nr:FG-GAP-like repeat-containing protein [Methanomicrobiales archaeon]